MTLKEALRTLTSHIVVNPNSDDERAVKEASQVLEEAVNKYEKPKVPGRMIVSYRKPTDCPGWVSACSATVDTVDIVVDAIVKHGGTILNVEEVL